MRDIGILPPVPDIKWGALTNVPPTRRRIRGMDGVFPANGRWHTLFEDAEKAHVDGAVIWKKSQSRGPELYRFDDTPHPPGFKPRLTQALIVANVAVIGQFLDFANRNAAVIGSCRTTTLTALISIRAPGRVLRISYTWRSSARVRI